MEEIQNREFQALRQTIQSRGTARPLAFLAGVSVWGATLVGVLVWLPNPLASMVPLLILVSTFEVVRTLHLGVERIGRYLQVFYEDRATDAASSGAAWETTAMTLSPTLPGAGGHPFFLPIALIATLLNFLAVVFPGPVVVELWTLAVPHVAFVVWMLYCDRAMRKQRTTELARYRALKNSAR